MKKTYDFHLSKQTSLFYKGVAIMMILAHNFFHWLPPKIGEHELAFSEEVNIKFWEALNFYPTKIFHIIISYMGWLAVPLFVFLSGYGLCQKYRNSKTSFLKLVINQTCKVYSLYLVGIVSFIIFCLFDNKLIPWPEIFQCLSLTNNFIPDKVFLLNGPWWFFSLIIQLYLIFPILYNALKKNYDIFLKLLFLYFIFIYLLTFLLKINTTYLYANFFGHIPEFSLGIFLALYPRIKSNIMPILWKALTLFFMSLFSTFFHPFIFISGTIILLYLCSFLKTFLRSNKLILFIGVISPYLFTIHGFLREYFMNLFISNRENGYECIIAFCAWFSMCVLIASLLKFSSIYFFKKAIKF